jgi:Omp85 superfamily domain
MRFRELEVIMGASSQNSIVAGKKGSGGRVGKMLSCAGVVALLMFGGSLRLSAQVEMPVDRDSANVGKISITGYPYIFYSPETEFAVGGALILSSRLSDHPDVKPSNMMLSGYYSAKGSYDVFLNPEFFLGADKYYLGITLDYWRFVDKFWGVGNQTVDTGDVGYIRKIIWLNVEFDVAVAGPLKVGVNVDLNRTHIEDKQSNPYLASGEVTGSDGGFTSGFGLVLFADTRNGAFYPTKGGYYKLALLNTFHWMGSQFTFVRWIMDLRQYISLTDRMVLAAQFYASGIGGDPPFYFLPALGGDNVERGYYEGRYRDKVYAAIQGELRLRLTRRWGLVGWIGTGDVSAGLSSFKLAQFKPSFGFGVRFALDPAEILNVRADFARGRETNGMYFNAKEAF